MSAVPTHSILKQLPVLVTVAHLLPWSSFKGGSSSSLCSHICVHRTASGCSMCATPINCHQQGHQSAAWPITSNRMMCCAPGASHAAAGSSPLLKQRRLLSPRFHHLSRVEQIYHHAARSKHVFVSPISCVRDMLAPVMLCASPSTVPAQLNSSSSGSWYSTNRRFCSSFWSGSSRVTRRWRSFTTGPFTFATRSSNDVNASGNGSSIQLPAVGEISSVLNPYIKHCVKLREKARYRQEQGRLLLVGSTLLSELAEASASLETVTLFIRPNTLLPAGVTPRRVITVTDAVMRKLTGLEEAAGVKVVAELALPAFVDLMAASQQDSGGEASGKSAVLPGPCRQLQRLLVLEGVQDPGNLGTLLRCATAFGWDAVWLLPGCADPFNDKALRASRGAALRCPMAVGSFEQLLAVVESRNMLLLAAEPENQQPHQQKHSNSSSGSVINSASRPVCLVLGTEGAGLSQQVLTAATPLSVPMVGRMESLNVGVAGAILMFALSDGGLEQLWSRLHQLRLS